jgi:hypothetical protein
MKIILVITVRLSNNIKKQDKNHLVHDNSTDKSHYSWKSLQSPTSHMNAQLMEQLPHFSISYINFWSSRAQILTHEVQTKIKFVLQHNFTFKSHMPISVEDYRYYISEYGK